MSSLSLSSFLSDNLVLAPCRLPLSTSHSPSSARSPFASPSLSPLAPPSQYVLPPFLPLPPHPNPSHSLFGLSLSSFLSDNLALAPCRLPLSTPLPLSRSSSLCISLPLPFGSPFSMCPALSTPSHPLSPSLLLHLPPRPFSLAPTPPTPTTPPPSSPPSLSLIPTLALSPTPTPTHPPPSSNTPSCGLSLSPTSTILPPLFPGSIYPIPHTLHLPPSLHSASLLALPPTPCPRSTHALSSSSS